MSMITYFPENYPDELLYSQLARYYVKSGYTAYRYAAENLFVSRTVRPDIEFVNVLTDDALRAVTRDMPMEEIIMRHTMFPYYGRFLPKERKRKAFQALVSMAGDYNNLLPIPKNRSGKPRGLRYCPACAIDDRKRYGETFWHRVHQMTGVNICPIHFCNLLDSSVFISGKASPALITAEESAGESGVSYCGNGVEKMVAEYVAAVFQSDIDMQSDVGIGQFLHSKMENTKYRSVRGEQRNIALFHTDFMDFCKGLPDNRFTELWQIQKVLTGDRINFVEICLMAMFLNVSVDELVHMELPERTQEQRFDEQIFVLKEQGLKYPEIAKRLGASVNVVKPIGEKRYGTYHKGQKEPLKSGAKTKDWEKVDKATLSRVRDAVSKLQGDGDIRPKKVSPFAIEKILGLPSKRLDNLPLCRAEIERHIESQQEYWAREVVWAVRQVQKSGGVLVWRRIRDLTNMRRIDFEACLPYLDRFIDSELTEQIKNLL